MTAVTCYKIFSFQGTEFVLFESRGLTTEPKFLCYEVGRDETGFGFVKVYSPRSEQCREFSAFIDIRSLVDLGYANSPFVPKESLNPDNPLLSLPDGYLQIKELTEGIEGIGIGVEIKEEESFFKAAFRTILNDRKEKEQERLEKK